MIDTAIIFKQLHAQQQKLFGDYQNYVEVVQDLWLRAVQDEQFFQKTHVSGGQTVVGWQEPITRHSVVLPCSCYQVLAIDGSQIYPDRHDDVPVSLINSGGIWLSYDTNSRVSFFSTPTICFQSEEHEAQNASFIDAQRHLAELEMGLEKARLYMLAQSETSLLLFDGALICWHLENDKQLFARYFERVCAVLDQLREENRGVAWYTSRPKSRDLVRLLRAYADSTHQEAPYLARYRDSDVLNNWLGVYERTTVFACAGEFITHYPPPLRPHFFYINSGAEIARVEIPAYIAQQHKCVEHIATMVVDQCIKGDGYPLALAEAHEQVVVKSADREAFRALVHHFAQRHNTALTISRKLMKKRSLAL